LQQHRYRPQSGRRRMAAQSFYALGSPSALGDACMGGGQAPAALLPRSTSQENMPLAGAAHGFQPDDRCSVVQTSEQMSSDAVQPSRVEDRPPVAGHSPSFGSSASCENTWELEQFIQANRRDLDEESTSLLRSLTIEEFRQVREAGPLSGCRYVVAVIKSRVRAGRVFPTSRGETNLEDFMAENRRWITGDAEMLLRSLGLADLDRVFAGGSLAQCRDAVAVVRSRLRGTFREGGGSGEERQQMNPRCADTVVDSLPRDPWATFLKERGPNSSTAGTAYLRARSAGLGGPGPDAGAGAPQSFGRFPGTSDAISGRAVGRSGDGLISGSGHAGHPSSGDAWGEFKACAQERAGIPIAPPSGPRSRASSVPLKPQLRTGHIPVLLQETLDALLAPGLPGIYVDGTFGRGGHSTEILKRLPPGGRLVAFDVDPYAIAVGRELEKEDPRFRIVHRPFGDIGDVLKGERLAGVMIDIGFSSPQVDQQHRGFSVVEDGPLDLRMNPTSGVPFSEWLRTTTPAEVAWIVREFGEDDDPVMGLRIAEAVLAKQQQLGEYRSTLDLAEVIRQVKMGQDDRGMHPAKLSFQAFRVFLNREMDQLTAFMEASVPLLQPGARAVVITFKRPEAAAVKQFLREHEEPCSTLERTMSLERSKVLYPLLQTCKPFAVRQACPPLVPSQSEVAVNRRCRSSMVHVLERLDRSQRWTLPSATEAAPPLTALASSFRRPRSVWRGAKGTSDELAVLPPRASGSMAATMLQPTLGFGAVT